MNVTKQDLTVDSLLEFYLKNCIGHYIIPFLEEENNGNGYFIYIALFTTTRVDQCALQ